MNRSSRWSPFSEQRTRKGRWSRRISWVEAILQLVGAAAVVAHLGVRESDWRLELEIGAVVTLGMLLLGACTVARWFLSKDRRLYLLEHRAAITVSVTWLVGAIVILLLGFTAFPRMRGSLLGWSESLIVIRAALGTLELVRHTASADFSPAFILAASFVILISIGTLLLTLPSARTPEADTIAPNIHPFMAALFTSTSACCVTGLVVVDTAAYWSRTGQVIIMLLIQTGGLGIMTFGGFAALVSGRSMQRREGGLLTELLESDDFGRLRRLIGAIVLFTFGTEALGALLLSGLWTDVTGSERAFFSVFHAVSAFCNAGFALTPRNESLVGLGSRWQTCLIIAGLIIVGGLGFGVLNDVAGSVQARWRNFRQASFVRLPRASTRLSLTSKLVLGTTVLLLVGGTAGIYLLDRGGLIGGMSFWDGLAAAWFQSVSCRTAGFNTVDIGRLEPSTKLFMVILMFIGASPVSTGGGVKTASFALSFLSVWSIMRDRDQVEILGRTVPDPVVKKAATIVGLGLCVVLASTLLVAVFEQKQTLFLDHLFEATSAFGTVGLSTGITPSLRGASKLVIVLTMFIGRVGPLTLLLAAAGRASAGRYQYPQERVTLG
ncbi:MAG TPA: potassium transporter TrkG [Planctomycetaceae bacterium]|nr:potassium transporter TrkG [Planctomycetaceae bacterium]